MDDLCVSLRAGNRKYSLSLALSTYLSFLCTVPVMDYFLAELIAKMGECLLAMQAPCGDQPRGWQA